MGGNMLKKFINLIKNNPPITLMIICILSLALATHYLSSYTENTNQLYDTDILLNTYQLKKYINDLKVCIKPNSEPNNKERLLKRQVSKNEQMIITAAVPIKDIDELSPNIVQIHGLISLEGFKWTCPIEEKPKYLEINFNKSDKVGVDVFCVQLLGPRIILENFLATECKSNYKYQPVIDGILQTRMHNAQGGSCENGTWVSFSFDRRENTDKFSLFLSKDDQVTVSKSLMWCTYFLFVISFLVIFFVIFCDDGGDEIDIRDVL